LDAAFVKIYEQNKKIADALDVIDSDIASGQASWQNK
jgi:hypothetical protein